MRSNGDRRATRRAPYPSRTFITAPSAVASHSTMWPLCMRRPNRPTPHPCRGPCASAAARSLLSANSYRWNAFRYLCLGIVFSVGASSNAQETPAPARVEMERMQRELADQLRHSRLTGPSDRPAIELPNGELISIARGDGCLPPASRGGVIQVDCTPNDGPAYYFDESTRAMIESCSFWFPDLKRCPPKRWPIEVSGCDGAIPREIVGTWRFFALPGSAGFYPTDGGWTMTLSDKTIDFDFYGVARIERAYAIIDRDDSRYSLELTDDFAGTARIAMELAPCGLLVEADAGCDVFCENVAREVGTPTDQQLREILKESAGAKIDEATLERILQDMPNEAERRRQPPRPLFPERALFRRVGND